MNNHNETNVIDNIYNEVYKENKLEQDLQKVLDESTLTYGEEKRELPRYVDGWLDSPLLQVGKPTRPKDLLLYNTVIDGNYTLIEIEGGVRGGKDVIALFCWARYLMTCPDQTHLALGSSLEHVLRTVLMSSGFGLYYTIPHGIFIRESVSGAQRGTYKFLDAYGIEKTVLFYGNDKENDSDKFQGFTLGSIYVNETLNQHIRGLEQAINRISSASKPLMLMTQNPKGASHEYYQRFEKPKLATDSEIKMMEKVRDEYKDLFEQVENKILLDMKEERRKVRKDYLNNCNVSKYKLLKPHEQVTLNKILLDINYKYDKIIKNITVQTFVKSLKENDYLYDKSMKRVVSYFRGEDNPNKIRNSYNFAYFHYTIEDNMKVSRMQINDFKSQRGVGTATYDQEVLGLRRSTEGAVYSAFNNKNIFSGDLKDFDWTSKVRFIAVDPGYSHPTGITDWALDLETGEAWCLQERLIDFNIEYTDFKDTSVIYAETVQLVRNLNDRYVDAIIIDPSQPVVINYFRTQGWNVFPADNSIWATRREEKETSHESVAKEMRGIPLIQTMIVKRKLYVHESCIELIKQIGSYTFKKTKDGTDKLQDLDDDLVDSMRYAINTSGIVPEMWLNESEVGISEQTRIQGNESEEDSEWDLGREIGKAFGNEYEEEFDFFSSEFNFFD